MASNLDPFITHAAANTNAFRDCLSWSMRIPSPDPQHRRHGAYVVVVVGKSLTVQVIEACTGRELAFGELCRGAVAWESFNEERFCKTASEMVQDRVRRALFFFARGIVSSEWIHMSRRGELRHVA
jgi:hypothetical protein